MFIKAPEIDVRKYLTEDERADYDGMSIAAVFSVLTAANTKTIHDLEKKAYKRCIAEITEKGYTPSTRDGVVGWIANKILGFASDEYKLLLWTCFRIGTNKLNLEVES